MKLDKTLSKTRNSQDNYHAKLIFCYFLQALRDTLPILAHNSADFVKIDVFSLVGDD